MFASVDSHEERAKVPVITSRREQYRQQIRRENLSARFRLIRNSMLEQEELLSLQATLGQLAEDYNDCGLGEVLLILQAQSDNAGFLLEVGRLRLEGRLLDLLQKEGAKMSLPQATGLMTALCSLTYFSQSTVQLLTDNIEFTDHLRERIGQLDLHNLEALRHLRVVLVLLMNTSSHLVQEYNNYLAESDLAQVVNVQLARTVEIARQQSEEYAQVAFEAREYCLRVYCNIVSAIDSQGQVPARLVGDVLRDEENLLRHPEKVFLLLAKAMKNERFWPCLMADNDSVNFCAPLSEAIDRVQQRCFQKEFLHDRHNQLTSEEARQFDAVILFLSRMFYQSEDCEICWSRLVETVLNGYMLGQFLVEAHQRREAAQVVHALRLFQFLARTHEVTGEQLIIVRPADDPLELLKVFTDIGLLRGERTGPACLEVLASLLKKDSSFLPAVMEFRVLDLLGELFESKEECVEIMSRGIELCAQLLLSEREAGKEKRVHALMETKGIIRAIERLNDSKEKRVYTLAEMFMEAANQEGK